MQFVREILGALVCCVGPRNVERPCAPDLATSAGLPLEIWESIMEYLYIWREGLALHNCALVCKQWHASLKSLYPLGASTLDSRKKVVQLARAMRTTANIGRRLKDVTIRGDADTKSHSYQSASHLGTFAAMLGGKLTRVERLTIEWANWKAGALHPDVYLHLSMFALVTDLTLSIVTLPNTTVFGRLVCAFPNLQRLCLYGVEGMQSRDDNAALNPATDPGKPSISTIFRDKHSKLSQLDLRLGKWQDKVDVVEFLVAVGWARSIRSLHVSLQSDVKYITTSCLRALLESAGASLRVLDLIIHIPGAPERKIIEEHLHLGANRNLESCSITLKSSTFFRAPGDDYDCMAQLLSQISSNTIQEVLLGFDTQWKFPASARMLDFSDDFCSQLDQALSRPQFDGLKHVIFEHLCPDGVLPVGEDPDNALGLDYFDYEGACWVYRHAQDHYPGAMEKGQQFLTLSQRLPRLHARGILRTAISVKLSDLDPW